jgi:hypothetical protein
MLLAETASSQAQAVPGNAADTRCLLIAHVLYIIQLQYRPSLLICQATG